MYLLALQKCANVLPIGNWELLVLYLLDTHIPHQRRHPWRYTGIAFTLPILGGWIADKGNYQSPILLGTLLTAAGCFYWRL